MYQETRKKRIKLATEWLRTLFPDVKLSSIEAALVDSDYNGNAAAEILMSLERKTDESTQPTSGKETSARGLWAARPDGK